MKFDNKKTFASYEQLARFIVEERRLGLSVYYWGHLENFSRWYFIEELAEDACEDWFDHGESVDIYISPSTALKHDIFKGLIAEYKEVHWDYFFCSPSEKMAIDDEVDDIPVLELLGFFSDKHKIPTEEALIEEIRSIIEECAYPASTGEFDENFKLFIAREFDKCTSTFYWVETERCRYTRRYGYLHRDYVGTSSSEFFDDEDAAWYAYNSACNGYCDSDLDSLLITIRKGVGCNDDSDCLNYIKTLESFCRINGIKFSCEGEVNEVEVSEQIRLGLDEEGLDLVNALYSGTVGSWAFEFDIDKEAYEEYGSIEPAGTVYVQRRSV